MKWKENGNPNHQEMDFVGEGTVTKYERYHQVMVIDLGGLEPNKKKVSRQFHFLEPKMVTPNMLLEFSL